MSRKAKIGRPNVPIGRPIVYVLHSEAHKLWKFYNFLWAKKLLQNLLYSRFCARKFTIVRQSRWNLTVAGALPSNQALVLKLAYLILVLKHDQHHDYEVYRVIQKKWGHYVWRLRSLHAHIFKMLEQILVIFGLLQCRYILNTSVDSIFIKFIIHVRAFWRCGHAKIW